MNRSTIASVPMLSWMNRTRSPSRSSSSTTEAREMPIEASCVSDFTMSGERQPLRPPRLAAHAHDHEVGHGDAVADQQRLRERLVAREHQPARVAARVGDPQQLEEAHDVAVEHADAVERLEQVEDDVGLARRRSPCGSGRGRPRRPAGWTSWPIERSVSATSNSIFHSTSVTSYPVTSSGGTRLACIRARTRSFFTAPPCAGRCAGSSWPARSAGR